MSIVLSNIEVSIGNVVVDINKYLQMLTQRITAVEKQLREMTKVVEPVQPLQPLQPLQSVQPISSVQNELIILRQIERNEDIYKKSQNELKEQLKRAPAPMVQAPAPMVQAPAPTIQAPAPTIQVPSTSMNIQVNMNKYLQMLTSRITDVDRKLRELEKKP